MCRFRVGVDVGVVDVVIVEVEVCGAAAVYVVNDVVVVGCHSVDVAVSVCGGVVVGYLLWCCACCRQCCGDCQCVWRCYDW